MDPNVDIDFSEVPQENIDDEILICIVKENPVLYVKTLKDYKNKDLKRDIWISIGKTLDCTGDQAEGRWNTLRNIFTKKLREMKIGQPSGSGYKKMKMWVYFKQMSFLAPHIAHRMSRSSVADSQQEKTMTSQSILKSSLFTEESTVKTMSSPLPSNNILNSENMLTCSDDNINNILSDNTSVSTSDQQSPVTVQDCEGNVLECVNNRMQQNKAADIVTEAVNNSIRKKKVVPAPDRFAAKRQKGMETMENVLSQSSHALNVVATAYMHRAVAAQQQEQHPYIVAINEAMKGVPDKEKITCFMSIMQVISECSRNK